MPHSICDGVHRHLFKSACSCNSSFTPFYHAFVLLLVLCCGTWFACFALPIVCSLCSFAGGMPAVSAALAVSSQLFVLHRHTQGNKKLLCNLPEDPPCLECLKVELIQEGDFRAGLKAGKDVTVHTASAIAQGTVLGLYRNLTVTKDEEEDIRDNPPAEFVGSKNQWRQMLDAYIADVEQPAKGSKAWRTFNDIFHNVLSVSDLHTPFSLCCSVRLKVVCFQKLRAIHCVVISFASVLKLVCHHNPVRMCWYNKMCVQPGLQGIPVCVAESPCMTCVEAAPQCWSIQHSDCLHGARSTDS